MTAQVQPDLFGEMDAAADAAARRAELVAAHRASFERPDVVLPWDCGLGSKGDVVQGWTCPDCRQVELTDFTLDLNHGWDPDRPEHRPYRPGECSRMILLGYQQRAREQREAAMF